MRPGDYELLQLAAKAAGMKLSGFNAQRQAFFIKDSVQFWNPISDNGDAFILAIRLNLFPSFNQLLANHDSIEPTTMSKPKRARYAFVRAAAEIGKAML